MKMDEKLSSYTNSNAYVVLVLLLLFLSITIFLLTDKYMTFAFKPTNNLPTGVPSTEAQKEQKTAPNNMTFSDNNSNSTLLKYQNSKYGLSMEYPANWETYTQADAMYSSGSYIIGFNSPDRTTSLNIEIEDPGQDLEEYAKKYNNIQEIQILDSESGPTNLDGNPSYKLVYTSNAHGTKIMHIFEKATNEVYYITYASTGKYYDYFPTIQKMIDSFEIKK